MDFTIDQTIPASIFRAYDIRGVVDETLTENGVYSIGAALALYAQEKNVSEVIVARDGRLSGPKLMAALIQGLKQYGIDVIDIGMVPTPLLYYATQLFAGRTGVMLTGSHNPKDYNGLKIVIDGEMCADADLYRLYERIQSLDLSAALPRKGTYASLSIEDNYLQEMLANIQLKRPLKIVIDAGNGVAGQLAPKIFRLLGCEVVTLFCDIDGTFPNHHPDPSDPKNLSALSAAVIAEKADLGFAFDGDGDRLGLVTSLGEIIYPDRMLMLFARALLKKQPHAKVIYDVKCTHHLQHLIHAAGGEPVMWKTGHSLIKAKLIEIDAQLAGEMSGHFFFRDRWYGFDDALYAGARLIEILSEENQSSHACFSTIPNSINTPELKILVRDQDKFNLMQALIDQADFDDALEIHRIDGLRINFKEGWGLIRPSNTTPYLILRFEALNEAFMAKIQTLFRDWLLSVKPDLVLPF